MGRDLRERTVAKIIIMPKSKDRLPQSQQNRPSVQSRLALKANNKPSFNMPVAAGENISEQPPLDSGIEDTRETPGPNCICSRPRKLVLCGFCGDTVMGRVRKSCHDHPSTIYLQDMVVCRGCKRGDKLTEFDVAKLPPGMDMDVDH